MAKADAGESDTPRREIRLVEEEGGGWSAIDEETGVASQGQSRQEALENLDEAVAGYHGEGSEPTREELIQSGIDPENNVSGDRLPDVLD